MTDPDKTKNARIAPEQQISDLSDCDVSVIVPAYQSAVTIGRAIESVLRQTCRPRELIIIDDGSTDATEKAIDHALADPGEINVIRLQQPNKGAAAARNLGIGRASGKYLAFLDADDEWHPDKLQQSMSSIVSDNLTMVSHNYWLERDGKTDWIDCAARFKEHPDPWIGLYRKGYVATSTVVVERAIVNQAGGFDETLLNAHDFDLWLRITDMPMVRFTVLEKGPALCHIIRGSVTSYTSRRLNCGVQVARRYISKLSTRSPLHTGNYFYRLAAIHVEAFRAHSRAGNNLAVMVVPLLLGWRVLTAPVVLLYPPAEVAGGLQSGSSWSSAEMPTKPPR